MTIAGDDKEHKSSRVKTRSPIRKKAIRIVTESSTYTRILRCVIVLKKANAPISCYTRSNANGCKAKDEDEEFQIWNFDCEFRDSFEMSSR